LDACVEWLNTSTWAASQDHLASHTLLLSDAGVTALAEIALSYPGDPQIERYGSLLAASRKGGIDAAYKPLLAADVAVAWRAISDLTDSKRFLNEHREELLSDHAMAALSTEDALGAALLTLVRSDQTDFAYQVLEHPETGAKALPPARRLPDAERLWAIATLCYFATTDDNRRTQAAMHIAIALSMGGESEKAVELTRQLRQGQAQTPELLDELADAITHHPQHAATLTALLRTLSTPIDETATKKPAEAR
jgi:hypothetical protein